MGGIVCVIGRSPRLPTCGMFEMFEMLNMLNDDGIPVGHLEPCRHSRSMSFRPLDASAHIIPPDVRMFEMLEMFEMLNR